MNIFRVIKDTGFNGYVGLEYSPLELPWIGLWRFQNWFYREGLL
ncbi:hypothetical protein [Gracilibacillus sp. YIM 98692]|nr:hypothetical protein [Gracilibacillus sp. YIM 98692]